MFKQFATIIFLVLVAGRPAEAEITRIWLTHSSNDPSKIVVNWTTEQPGNSVVRYAALGPDNYHGSALAHATTIEIDQHVTVHHVEIPLDQKDTAYHYTVSSGNESSPIGTFKSYPTDELLVAVVADWQGKPNLDSIIQDYPHLLLTAGDNISSIHQLCGSGNEDCIQPYADLIDHYPDMFRSIPFMPVLGNHDKEIRPRGDEPPEEPVYDIDATAFRRFFELPDDEWKWHFDIPDFGLRFVALDLNHVSDFGTTWQACHAFDENSEQFGWYRDLMTGPSPQFVVTLYNERNANIRTRADGKWHEMFRKGTIAITGFGYFAERAELDGFTYYNTALGTGEQYPDPHSQFLESEDSYILLTFTKKPPKMVVEIKGLGGSVLDRKEFSRE